MGVTVREKVRGSGIWWVFASEGGRRKSKRLGSKKAADQFADRVRVQLADGDLRVFEPPAPPAPVVAVPTFGAFASRWLERHAASGGRHGSHAIFASAITHHLRPYFADRALSTISPSLIEDFISHLRTRGSVRYPGKGLSEVSVQSIVAVLGRVLRFAVREKAIAASPMGDVEFGQRRRISPDPDPFLPAEIRKIIAAARELDMDAAVLFELWARTGARAGEITALRPMDLDYDAGTVWIRQTYSRGRVGPTKTAKSTRRISFGCPILEDVADWRPRPEVAAAMSTRLRQLKRVGLDPSGPLFISPGGTAWSSSSVSLIWRRALARAGVRFRVGEVLRHSMASILLARSAPVTFVARQGGWSSAVVLLSVYAAWIEQGADAAAPQGHPDRADAGQTP